MTDHRPLISHSVAGIAVSAIKEMAMRAAKIRDTASLTWGVPSFRTPEHIRHAVKRALENDPDIGKYTLPDGLPQLRAAAADTHRTATGSAVDPDRNVTVTAGNMEGVKTLLRAILDPGDEVIVTDPGFASHFIQIGLVGAKAVFWRLDEARDWALDLEALPGLVTVRTKAILLVSPSNPTGRIFTRDELLAVGRLAAERGLLVILDDPYCHFIYENRERYFNLSSVAELADHVAYLFTFSKCHAMSGWRLGYAILPDWLKREILKVHDATMICAPRISQVAGLAALRGEQDHLQDFETRLANRRELICARLDAVPHVFDYVKPEGAYYVFPRILANHRDSNEFSIRLLEEAKVVVTPGRAFGPAGEHHVRMAFCVDEPVIETAFDRLETHFGR
ncbi:MAG: pyridoxal phosphate-dependent aminotransferase [Alphaproteobacteria bacterium]|nr:pyridoxal phosphate-dependent aminotransferase [Alphaproteobacteria bacterium]